MSSFKIIDKATDLTLAILPTTIPIGSTIDGFTRAGYDVTWSWHKDSEPTVLESCRYYVVHAGTDTIIDLSECRIVDLPALDVELDGDDYCDDLVILQAAEQYGIEPNIFRWGIDYSVCPVSELTGEYHSFISGSGQSVPWSVMGDPRSNVAVCPSCAAHTE